MLRDGVLHADLCIIGAGSGGLSVAAGAVQMVASVVAFAVAHLTLPTTHSVKELLPARTISSFDTYESVHDF